jgi:hypothetical protein
MGKGTNIKIGDSVVVKDGVKSPDMESLSIAGWQGRVSDISDGENDEVLVDIKLDSITLRSLPEGYIRQSEEEGLDWATMVLLIDEVEPAQPRDTEKDVQLAIDEFSSLYRWSYLGEEGVRIGNVLKGIDPSDMYLCMKAWSKHLKKALVFPFDAEIAECDDRGPLEVGDRIRVHSIAIVDDLYGVIVDVRLGRFKYAHPLCDLEVLDKKSSNYQNVQDYAVWFANM